MSPVNRESFTSSFPVIAFYFCPVAVTGMSSVVLSRSDECGFSLVWFGVKSHKNELESVPPFSVFCTSLPRAWIIYSLNI